LEGVLAGAVLTGAVLEEAWLAEWLAGTGLAGLSEGDLECFAGDATRILPELLLFVWTFLLVTLRTFLFETPDLLVTLLATHNNAAPKAVAPITVPISPPFCLRVPIIYI